MELLTPAKLLEQSRQLRSDVLANAGRIPGAKQIANWLGQIETTLVAENAKVAPKKDPKQTELSRNGTVGGTKGA